MFLPCTYWLCDNYAMTGRMDEARALFERLLALRNDVGLLSEQYDPASKRLLGNFPQAFSHVSLVNTALNLTRAARTGARSQTQLVGEVLRVRWFERFDRCAFSGSMGLAGWVRRFDTSRFDGSRR